MQFDQCIKCRLLVPVTRMIPVTISRGNQKFRARLCYLCKEETEKQMQERND
jgi:hypothetical protein